MRYIKIPFFWETEDGELESSQLRINPFTIDSYHATKLEHEDIDGNTTERDVCVIFCRSGISYQILLPLVDLERTLNDFYKS